MSEPIPFRPRPLLESRYAGLLAWVVMVLRNDAERKEGNC